MRVLLDECLPKRLKKHLAGHETWTVPEAGWAGKKNGEILRVAAGKFEAFITIDSNLSYQQNVSGLPFGVIVLFAPTNRLDDLVPLVPHVLSALASLGPGQIVKVGG
jgi:predicted nuclease of predicted toxin-antitoxin system